MANVDYGQILKRSKVLVFRERWLWVYGLILAAMGGGSSGSGGSSSPSSNSNKDKVIQELPKNLPDKVNEVLGAATTAITDWFYSVPVGTWILIGVGILLLILAGIAFSMFVKNWAKGALIFGLDEADSERPAKLATTSARGIDTVKPLIFLGIRVTIIVLGVLLAVLLLFGLGFAVFSQSKAGMIIWGLTIGLLGLGIVLATIILTGFASIYAERLIVLAGFSAKDAFGKAFGLAKGNFFPTLVMGIINSAIGCAVGCVGMLLAGVVLGIPGAVIIVPAFAQGFHMPSVPALIVLAILFFIFIQFNVLVSAGMVVFNTSNWNIFVKEILKQEEKK